jgi:hypothetical protein
VSPEHLNPATGQVTVVYTTVNIIIKVVVKRILILESLPA